MALVGPGDKVLIPDPYYATYEAVVRAPGAELVPVPATRRGLPWTAAALVPRSTPDCRVLLLNNPHNPAAPRCPGPKSRPLARSAAGMTCGRQRRGR